MGGIKRQKLLDSVQGYYATILLLRLSRIGILEKMLQPVGAELLAEHARVDSSAMQGILEFLVTATDLVERFRDGTYQLQTHSYKELLFNLEKFAGAYGPAAMDFGGKTVCAAAVNYHSLAAAFAEVAGYEVPYVPQMILESDTRYLLDLGCGTGSMLIDVCGKTPDLRGLGLDASGGMCRAARRAVAAAQLNSRIKIRRADGGNLSDDLFRRECRQVDGIYGRSFLNEFFGDGERGIIKTLNRLHHLFEGRRAWFVDYFGQLGTQNNSSGRRQLGVVQDVAQLVSGQGVPPANNRDWRRIYKYAGCRLQESHEFKSPDIGWFIHEVIL